MKDTVSAAELVKAQETIQIFEKQIDEFKAALRKWKIDVNIEVDIDTFDIKISAIKPFGGGGIIKTITGEEVLAMYDASGTLTTYLADTIYEKLLRDELRASLSDKLERAIKNIETAKRVMNK